MEPLIIVFEKVDWSNQILRTNWKLFYDQNHGFIHRFSRETREQCGECIMQASAIVSVSVSFFPFSEVSVTASSSVKYPKPDTAINWLQQFLRSELCLQNHCLLLVAFWVSCFFHNGRERERKKEFGRR